MVYLILFLFTGAAALGPVTLTVRHNPPEQGLYTRTMDIQFLPRDLRRFTSLLRRAPPKPRSAKRAKTSHPSSPPRASSSSSGGGNKSPATQCKIEGTIKGPACYTAGSDGRPTPWRHVAADASEPVNVQGTKFASVLSFTKEHPTAKGGATLTATGPMKAQAVVGTKLPTGPATRPSNGGGTVFSLQRQPNIETAGPDRLMIAGAESPANGAPARVSGGLYGTGIISVRCKGPGADTDPSCQKALQVLPPVPVHDHATEAKMQEIRDF